MRSITGSALAICAVGLLCTAAGQPAPPSPTEVRSIAEKAYTYAYPLVLMEFTRRVAPDTNQFTHAATFPDEKFRRVIRPNADTLYSSSWLDLSKEPVLLHVADTKGRYYLMQFLDAWTETFSVPGKRTTGTADRWFAVVGPGWKGKLPERAERIDSPTSMVWLIGRTQTNNASDYANVHAIQKGFTLMPLSLYPDGPRPRATTPPPNQAPASAPPPVQVERLSAVEFFRIFAGLLAANPPHAADQPMLRELARIGIAPGKPFHPEALGAEGLKELDAGAHAASEHLLDPLSASNGRPKKNGWADTGTAVGRYGTDYAARAAIARFGLGALPAEDATYVTCDQDSAGRPLDGSHRYRMHFTKAQIPPVRAFWSLTMYGDDGYFVQNPIQRFAIGDRDALKFNADGSLDLYIQHDAPGGDQDRNWLPAPQGKFNLILRLYWPSEEVLNGRWTPPAVTP